MQYNTKRTRLRPILKGISRAGGKKKCPAGGKNVAPTEKKKTEDRINEKHPFSVQCCGLSASSFVALTGHLGYLTIIYRSGGKYPPLNPTLR